MRRALVVAAWWLAASALPANAATEEFCLRGELDLGARLQGLRPSAGERYPESWCVASEPDGERVWFGAKGRPNADVEDSYTLAYLAADRVRLVNAASPPDIDFRGALVGGDARAVRRVDPRRLMAELEANPKWIVREREGGWRDVRWPGAEALASVQVSDGRLARVRTVADLPLRGRVPVVWEWSWPQAHPEGALVLRLDGEVLFRATGERRTLSPEQAEALWRPSGDKPPREVPGRAWPAAVRMSVDTLQPGVHMVRGVRTGFHHLVVETARGLVVADAPAGWVELQRIPPADLVPGLGVSGLSERFVDFLRGHFPGVPIRAVAITHFHDDHAGGARAFAAAGAEVYAPAEVALSLERALNRDTMPADRLSHAGRKVRVKLVAERVVLDDARHPVELVPLGRNPHVEAALGVHVPSAKVFFQSDLHVPVSDAPAPRAERARTECWFARWAKERLDPATVVLGSHGSVALPAGRIAAYLDHELCRP